MPGVTIFLLLVSSSNIGSCFFSNHCRVAALVSGISSGLGILTSGSVESTLVSGVASELSWGLVSS